MARKHGIQIICLPLLEGTTVIKKSSLASSKLVYKYSKRKHHLHNTNSMIHRHRPGIRGTSCLMILVLVSWFHHSATHAFTIIPQPATLASSPTEIARPKFHRHRSLCTFTAVSAESRHDNSDTRDENILCDLQTLLRLTGILSTGGSAKVMIQSGGCQLNGVVETRRAKKLFPGDVVTIDGVDYSADAIVDEKGYTYKPKQKKIKPEAEVDEFGNKEFGGRFRSEEWRADRKQKKLDKKQEKREENWKHSIGKRKPQTEKGNKKRRWKPTHEKKPATQADQLREFLL